MDLQASSSTNVAFFVGLLNDFDSANSDSDFKFQKEVTNISGVFNKSTGKFTAPVKATYQFSVTISAQKTQKAAFHLRKTGQADPVMTVTSNSAANLTTSTMVAILSLNNGDQVWLEPSTDFVVYGGMNTSFSGVQLF